MSRRERKIYNAGKRAGHAIGYAEGYAQGIYDGNPFNALVDAMHNVLSSLKEQLHDPEFINMCIEAQKQEEGADMWNTQTETEP